MARVEAKALQDADGDLTLVWLCGGRTYSGIVTSRHDEGSGWRRRRGEQRWEDGRVVSLRELGSLLKLLMAAGEEAWHNHISRLPLYTSTIYI